MIKVLHVITGLDIGGAEMVLLRLVEEMDRSRFTNSVISLRAGGQLRDRLKAAGAEVLCLRSGTRSPVAPFQVFQEARRSRPDVMQTWMYHGDVHGGLGGWFARAFPIVWGIHAGPLPPKGQKPMMKLGVRILGRLSHRIPTRIVCCSRTSLAVHAALGYAREKMVVIPNGFDSAASHTEAASKLRNQLGLPPNARLIGRIGRFHPQKDIPNLIHAFSRLQGRPHLLLAGSGMSMDNIELRTLMEDLVVIDRVHLVGEVAEPSPLYCACDVVVSSSAFGEAMPLVLGEAMSLGVPVVTTDVGDSKDLVADHERVVPPSNPSALSAAIQRMLDLPEEERLSLGERDRRRISTRFSRAAMVDSYERLYEEVAC